MSVMVGALIWPVIDKEPCWIEVTIEGRHTEQGRPTLVLGCCVSTLLDEKPCEIIITPL